MKSKILWKIYNVALIFTAIFLVAVNLTMIEEAYGLNQSIGAFVTFTAIFVGGYHCGRFYSGNSEG